MAIHQRAGMLRSAEALSVLADHPAAHQEVLHLIPAHPAAPDLHIPVHQVVPVHHIPALPADSAEGAVLPAAVVSVGEDTVAEEVLPVVASAVAADLVVAALPVAVAAVADAADNG